MHACMHAWINGWTRIHAARQTSPIRSVRLWSTGQGLSQQADQYIFEAAMKNFCWNSKNSRKRWHKIPDLESNLSPADEEITAREVTLLVGGGARSLDPNSQVSLLSLARPCSGSITRTHPQGRTAPEVLLGFCWHGSLEVSEQVPLGWPLIGY